MDNTSSNAVMTAGLLAFNRNYLIILVGYIQPPFILIGTLTNFLSIIGIGMGHFLSLIS